MPCYHPLTAYRSPGGGISFNEGGDSGSQIELPCGRCLGCRKKRTREWAIRCMHEAQMHTGSSFVTLTYGDSYDNPSLDYRHFQHFLRNLRKTTPVRFFVAGEYGELNKRPHWHALLFGVTFPNLTKIGDKLYRSPALEALWQYGYSSIGEVNYTTASYVASYCIKKSNGLLLTNTDRYKRVDLTTGEIITVTPEMLRMSLKPGIGATWWQKYNRETAYARDGIVLQGGRQQKTPRYYDKLLQKKDIKQFIELETTRLIEANKRKMTEKQLIDAEINAYAKQKMKQRKL